jgi:hypothetical protein
LAALEAARDPVVPLLRRRDRLRVALASGPATCTDCCFLEEEQHSLCMESSSDRSALNSPVVALAFAQEDALPPGGRQGV